MIFIFCSRNIFVFCNLENMSRQKAGIKHQILYLLIIFLNSKLGYFVNYCYLNNGCFNTWILHLYLFSIEMENLSIIKDSEQNIGLWVLQIEWKQHLWPVGSVLWLEGRGRMPRWHTAGVPETLVNLLLQTCGVHTWISDGT